MVKCEGKRPLGRPAHKQEKSITTDPKEIVYEGGDWIDLAQDRNTLVCTCECGEEPRGST